VYTQRAVHEIKQPTGVNAKMITIEYKWTTEDATHSKCVDFDTNDDLHALELAERFKANVIPANALNSWFDYA
jgi:hypothetical protein